MNDTRKIIKSFLNTDKLIFSIFLFVFGINLVINLLTNSISDSYNFLPAVIWVIAIFTISPPLSSTCGSIPKLLSLNVPRKKIIKGYFSYIFAMMFINTCIITFIVIIFNKLSLFNISINRLFIFMTLCFLILSTISLLIGWIVIVFFTKGIWYGLSNILIISGIIMISTWKIVNLIRFGAESPLDYIGFLAVNLLLAYLSSVLLKKFEVTY